MAEERSVSDVFQDILRNLQEMVRSEIRLAKVEIRGEAKQAVSSGVWIAAGGVAATSASIFLLWTLAYDTRHPHVDVGGNIARRCGDGRRCGGAHHERHSPS